MSSDPRDRQVGRRRFFREGFRELLRPLAGAIEPLEQTLRQFEKATASSTPVPQTQAKRVTVTVWQRPPGALPEKQFRETCSKCGECVRVCPVHAIQLDSTGQRGEGVPFIEAEIAACVLCDGLYCMQTCPSGALRPLPLADIDMGVAVWREETCTRTLNDDCSICVDKCPLGTSAIRQDHNEIIVNPLVCNGCGVCQQYCPTAPKSINVIPIAAKQT